MSREKMLMMFKRQTKQLRIEVDWYEEVKTLARRRGITMSKVMDEICQYYFDPPEERNKTILDEPIGDDWMGRL